MTTKTITITERAYGALKNLKRPRESFSKTIIRVTKRKPLKEFFGVLGKESGKRFEENIMKLRKQRNKAHEQRLSNIINELSD